MKRGMLTGVACILLSSGAAQSQNLVTNGDFDEDLSGWEVLGPAPGIMGTTGASHEPVDALDVPNSGSALIEWDLTDPLGMVPNPQLIFRTCNATALEGGTLIPGGWAGEGLSVDAGSAFVRFCTFRDTMDCTGGSSCGSGEVVETSRFEFDAFFRNVDPEGAQSVGIEVIAELASDGLGNSIAQGSFRLDKVYYQEMEEPPLAAEISLQGIDGATVSFIGTASDGQSPYQALYIWDFGDGTESTDQNPTHTYASPGAYQVSLLVNTGFEQAIDQIEVVIEGPSVEIPTMTSVGILALIGLLGFAGLYLMKARRARS